MTRKLAIALLALLIIANPVSAAVSNPLTRLFANLNANNKDITNVDDLTVRNVTITQPPAMCSTLGQNWFQDGDNGSTRTCRQVNATALGLTGSANVTSTASAGVSSRVALWTNATNIGNTSIAVNANGDATFCSSTGLDCGIYLNGTATGPNLQYRQSVNRMVIESGPTNRFDIDADRIFNEDSAAVLTLDLYSDSANRSLFVENTGIGQGNIRADDYITADLGGYLGVATAPPVTCAGGVSGLLYTDSTAPATLCICNSTAWVNLGPAGTCA